MPRTQPLADAAPLPPRGGRSAPGRRREGVLLRHEAGALLRVAGPIVVSQLGNIAMNTTDTIMVAPLGAEPLAAAGLGASLQSVVLMVCTGLVLGTTPLVSQAFGAGRRDECRHVVVQGCWAALALALPLFLFLYAGGAVSRVLDQPPAVAALAGDYMRALAWGALPVMLFMAFRQYLEGMGRTTPPMVVTFGAVVLNVGANYLFIYGAGGVVEPMGVVGAGWATTLVRWGMLAALAAYLARHAALSPFRGISWRMDAPLLRRIGSIGGPIAVQMGAEVGVFAFAAVMMGWIGPVPQAAHNVTINLAATTFMVALGASLAGSIRVGQHIGAGSVRAARRAAVATYAVSMGFMGLCALAFLAAPRWLLGLYTHDPAIVAVGVQLLFMAALFQLFDGAQVSGLCVLRGAADTRVPMVYTLLGYWAAGFPAAYLLGFRTSMGPAGVWAGLVLALGVVAVLLGVRVRRVLWAKLVPRRALRPA